MGKIKYLDSVTNLFNKSPIVDFESIKKHVKNSNYAKLLVHNLIVKNKINKITKGFYTKHNNPELAVFTFNRSYLGLQDALSFYNLWEQETIPIIITSQKVRTGIRTIMGSNVLIRHIDSKFLFGYDYVKKGELAYPYSDVEKTFIDMVYFKENLNQETIRNIIKKINKKRLCNYLKKYPKKFREIIMNYLK